MGFTGPYGNLNYSFTAMQTPATIQSFSFHNHPLEAFVPDSEWIQQDYLQRKAAGSDPAFPYWAKVWPAAKALCEFMALQPEIVKDLSVLELAAGIGLPSLLAARFAKSVIASDYMEEAVDIIQRSVIHNNCTNVQAQVLDWSALPENVQADVLLLSDINYDPASFDVLYKVLQRFLQKGSTILLSTPQRIAGRAFMERLLPWCFQQEEFKIAQNDEIVYITIWVLVNEDFTNKPG